MQSNLGDLKNTASLQKVTPLQETQLNSKIFRKKKKKKDLKKKRFTRCHTEQSLNFCQEKLCCILWEKLSVFGNLRWPKVVIYHNCENTVTWCGWGH